MQIPFPYMESAERLWLRVQEMAGFDSVISDTFPLVSPSWAGLLFHTVV